MVFFTRNFVRILNPKILPWIAIVLIMLGFIQALRMDDFLYLGLFSSISGIVGACLVARQIFRKGVSKLVYEARHKDYGSCAGETEEDRQTDLDSEAQVSGTLILLLSAFFVFLSEIIAF